MKPLGNVPDYLAAWDLVVEGDLSAGRAALVGGTVRGDYLAAAVRDVVLQIGYISGKRDDGSRHPISLQAHPTAPGYLLKYVDAFDHGRYEDYEVTYPTLWEAAVRYVQFAWPRQIQGFAVSWEV